MYKHTTRRQTVCVRAVCVLCVFWHCVINMAKFVVYFEAVRAACIWKVYKKLVSFLLFFADKQRLDASFSSSKKALASFAAPNGFYAD